MKRFIVTACLLTGALLANGCATKKYVRNTVAPVQAKVDQVGEQANQNSQAIEETRGQLKQVDERAQSGISAAEERAATADQHAVTADQHATNGMSRASEAQQTADRATRDLDNPRQVVANIDDYKQQSSATVLFKFNQSTLTSDAKRQPDKIVAEAKSDKRFFITVEGFTDRVGSRQYNEMLSEKRAHSVARYLVTQHDIPIHHIHMVGLGQDKPVANGRTSAALAQNRRVEVKVFSADGVTASLNGASESSAGRESASPPNE
jgi:outer membrane protein OmpA-like peptidoglycan-associated protein